jgi:hypothetical protein
MVCTHIPWAFQEKLETMWGELVRLEPGRCGLTFVLFLLSVPL